LGHRYQPLPPEQQVSRLASVWGGAKQ
jgi:hypothetical protein